MRKNAKAPLTICVIGGAAIYTPELIKEISNFQGRVPIDTVRLYDTNIESLEIITSYSRKLADVLGCSFALEAYDDRNSAIRDADVIIIQFRIGGLEARSEDIKLCLRHGLIGEETTGVGGLCLALRTIPELLDLSTTIRHQAPEATVINLSNPTGIGTGILRRELNSTRVFGLCTTPHRLHSTLATCLGANPDDIAVDYVGLNHFSWVLGVASGERGVLEKDLWLPYGTNLIQVKEAPDLIFSSQFLRALGMIPSPYLHYYYHRATILDVLQRMPLNRAEIRMRSSSTQLDVYKAGYIDLAEKSPSRTTLYFLLMSLLDAVTNEQTTRMVVNIKNENTISGLPNDCTIEVPCIIDSGTTKPINEFGSWETLPLHLLAMISMQAYCERMIIKAGTFGDRKSAIHALVTHPLGPEPDAAETVFEDILKVHGRYMPQF